MTRFEENQAWALVVDGREDTRKNIAGYLARRRYIPVPAASGAEALTLVEAFSPLLALINVALPDMPGAQLATRLKRLCPEAVVVFITAHCSTEAAVELAYPITLDRMLEGLNKSRILYPTPTSVAPNLTKRERDIVMLLAEGYSNQQIAQQLGLTEQSVKNRLRGVYGKLRVNTRAQAIVRAIELELKG